MPVAMRILDPAPPVPQLRALKPLSKRAPQRREPYWTRGRVLDGLRRWYREQHTAPTSTELWQSLTTSSAKMADRSYPCFSAVLGHFATFREAWLAAGVLCDRDHEEWTPDEQEYLRDGAGIIPRVEMARDLRRSPDAVHRRLYDLGLHSYRVHGWTINRLRKEAGPIVANAVSWCAKHGRIPCIRGTKCYYVQPADMAQIAEINWLAVPEELQAEMRRGLMARLAGIVAARVEAKCGRYP